MRLHVLDAAALEAAGTARHYNSLRRGIGDRFYSLYSAALRQIEEQPLYYPKLETVRSNRNFRRCRLKRFPYVMMYEILEDKVVVLAVAHTSRRNYWLRRVRNY